MSRFDKINKKPAQKTNELRMPKRSRSQQVSPDSAANFVPKPKLDQLATNLDKLKSSFALYTPETNYKRKVGELKTPEERMNLISELTQYESSLFT